jgi:hypothetical protein
MMGERRGSNPGPRTIVWGYSYLAFCNPSIQMSLLLNRLVSGADSDIYIEKSNNDKAMNSDKKIKEQEKTVQIEIDQNLVKMKKCSKCKKLLPIEHFHRDENYKDGYTNKCRKCVLDYKHTLLKKSPVTDERYKKILVLVKKREENEKIVKDGFKICNLCNRKLPLSEFNKHKGRVGGVNDECCDCVSKRSAARYKGLGFTAPERIKTIRQRAKDAKLPCDIDPEFLEKKFDEQRGLCFYSKLPMTKEVGKSNIASVDRIQASKGYTRDNVVL